jgi:ADP-heptose:LPS heptosyltransferase
MQFDVYLATSYKLGDSVNTTSFLIPLKEKWPEARIHWITSSKYEPIVVGNPYIYSILNEENLDERYLTQKYKNLLMPEPLKNTEIPYPDYWQKILQDWTGSTTPMRPLLFQRFDEVKYAEEWLEKHKINKFVMLETDCHSNQSFWTKDYTLETLKLMRDRGYSVVLTHMKDDNLEEYNKICHTVCMDLSYRYAPILYNRSRGFMGVSSGISCITHTHECLTDLPHLEFVSDIYYSICAYYKKKKTIWWNPDMDSVLELIDKEIK